MLSPKVKVISVIGLIAIVSVFAFAPKIGPTRLVVATGTVDSYGQQIAWFAVYQSVSGAWTLRDNVTAAEYISGINITIQAGQALRFFAGLIIDDGFAVSEAEAMSFTRCYITIVGEVARTAMTDDNASVIDWPGLVGTPDAWIVRTHYYWSPTGGKPLQGETYLLTLDYEAFFDPDDYTP